MKPILRFELQEMKVSELGKEASIPDLLGGLILQNNLAFHLEEDDEIFEGYGTRSNSFPYRQYNTYTRTLTTKKMKTAVLENDFICATFLPELGGRLWKLIDKKEGKNLLYTNDVIRYSNLAVRNAWFSGGVEWNIGVIGHTPLTTEPLFTATLQDEKDNPILRMYEYERIRGVEYQMDFWLGEQDNFLNCRMRIVNSSKEVVPMYWWSNMAVPEYQEGRIVVPAKEAFTYEDGAIYKVEIPMVGGVDISQYEDIPRQVDYFFHIPKESPKYITNLDKEGYGLFQVSTQRLQSRKLFSWGNNISSGRWQNFLTEDAGRYVEIQAGLGKTQYGCIPMPPHSAWEWVEQYGPMKMPEGEQKLPFEKLQEKVTAKVEAELHKRKLEEVLTETKVMAKSKGEVVYTGSGYGALKNFCREMEHDRKLSEHLDFGECEMKQLKWLQFLKTGILEEIEVSKRPEDFMCDTIFFEKLKETIHTTNKNNWYAYYQLGVCYFEHKNYQKAAELWEQSLHIKENPWAYHGIATLDVMEKKYGNAVEQIRKGLAFRKEDLSYLKETFRFLLLGEAFHEVIRIYRTLSEEMQKDSRLLFGYITALYKTGEGKWAYELLMENGGLELEDIREGEDSIGQLWKSMHDDLYGKEEEIPYFFQFNSFL
ncbi:MAG: DUF5107 domain-containing protein [Lachnospiraceae bacterium]|nr:DUF5107 domain-containing protein [Lachnospiraceae bacterium]